MARWKSKPGVKSGKSKVLSGFCENGCHEGMKPKGLKSQALMTCTLLDTCDCSCHIEIDRMFEINGRPRIAIENPEYAPDRGHYVMPTYEQITEARLARESSRRPVENRKPLEATSNQLYEATPTGKRARGQLEDQVLVVCSQFSRGQLDVEVLTPVVIAREIDEVEPPSVGAIGAVFDRWVRIGFANCAKKPVRFESFTERGLELGLGQMKEQFKARARRESKGAAAARMGVGR